LEVLLFVLAEAELDAEGELDTFYKNARLNWSQRLDAALSRLDVNGGVVDRASARLEELELAAAGVGVVEAESVGDK
jgi:hypothetical protein